MAAGAIIVAPAILVAGCGSGTPQKSTATTTVTAAPTASVPAVSSTSSATSSATSTTKIKYLNEMDPLTSTAGVDTSAATVNGKGFPRSITQTVSAGGAVNEAEYNLDRHWNHFNATIGLRDDSPSGGQLTFEVSADGKPLYKQVVTLGETQDVNLDLNGALRLKLTVTYSGQDTTYYYGTWGDAVLQA